ncbi:MAG: hypothetical protein D6739_03535 [Nitrospirae bacterium]|nr:MAG: hypothetical protein D6739_03535 [Nitrospirota bacterium]
MVWPQGEDRRRALRLLRVAERERFRHRSLHQELFKTIRFEVGWRDTCPEGLPPGALEVEAPFRPLFRALARWGVARSLNRLGLWRLLGWRVADLPARLAPALGLLVVERPAVPAAFFAAGRGLERLWLAATAHGLALQPLAAPGVLALQERQPATEISRGVLRRLLGELQRLAPEGHGLLFFRLGWAAPPAVVAGRRPVDSFFGRP